ncbi:MAG: PD-(D/E)XK nuclease family protein [Dehalococcoidia bacterium]|nr:PD-(D/E)XK nuclease family protein [Dehalococcoidia bacterium]
MTVERHFLGWDEPVVSKIRRFLIGDGTPDPDALAGLLLLVPTQQSGRRLRQSLASHSAAHGVHLGYLRPRLPIDLVRVSATDLQVASSLESMALWARLLLDVDYSHLTSLFPAREQNRTFSWALATGKLLQNLRYQLAAAGLTIRKVTSTFSDVLEEPDRWAEMASLEESYLALVARVGRVDAGESRIQQSQSPTVPEGTTRIVLACTPDPDPIALHGLEHLAQDYPVQVLIHAPETMADRFDEWGRPLADKWRDAFVDIVDAERNLRLAGTPAEQSRLAVSILTEAHYGPLDIGIGVPDAEVVPFLSSEMAVAGLKTYDPDGKPMAAHPLFGLLESYRLLVDEGSYTSLAAFLRHPDVLHHLHAEMGLTALRVLTDLDKFQNYHLPSDFRDVCARLQTENATSDPSFASLAAVVERVRTDMLPVPGETPSADMRAFLQNVFSHRRLSFEQSTDTEFTAVAQQVVDLLSEYDDSCVESLRLGTAETRRLFIEQLRSAHYDVTRPAAAVDLEGWLELHWNDAPFLLVTGMNEGKVPEGITGDPFLPDSLRRQLGLRDDADRLARDTYLMQAYVESRRSSGRVCFIAGKTGSGGDPLKPSRLLFNCDDGSLPERARMLFGTPESHTVHYPATTSFLLLPTPPSDLPVERHDIQSLPVTGFKDYLSCPFRFYLRRVLRMEPLGDRKKEMDALDFGSLIHDVLSRLAADSDLRSSTDAKALTRFLHEEAIRWTRARFGTSLPLNLQMQLDAARERLSAAAHAQAREAADGWEIVLVEFPVECIMGDLRLHGRIDRVDRQRHTGQSRVLDYKTSDNGTSPDKEHLKGLNDSMRDYTQVLVAGKERRWVDLQLPLYSHMLATHSPEFADTVPGYFNIPGRVDETGVKLWDGFTPELRESAITCARGVAMDLRDRRFWPPSPRVTYDDFESLFHVEPGLCIDVDPFQEYMRSPR